MTPIPEVIARYRIVRELGHGGMGTLYLAEDPALDRLVAIKVLKNDSDELRQRFIREARMAARLRHVNIVSIFELGESHTPQFIAMEYIPGETLGEIVKRRAVLSLTRKLTLIEDLCAGLAYAHRAGITHRDIKPDNVMVDADGILKILDFGIARPHVSGLTRSGVIMGTLNYMSPESLLGHGVDARSDIFAVGAVFYELLSYRKAFPGGVPEVFTRILHDDPDGMDAFAESVPSDIVDIVRRAVAKSPEARYGNLTTMRQDLVHIRQQLGPDPSAESEHGLVAESALVLAQNNLGDLLTRTRAALDVGDVDMARRAFDAAEVLDARNPTLLELHARLKDVVSVRQVNAWIEEARELLEDGSITDAHEIAVRAENLTPGSRHLTSLWEELEGASSGVVRTEIQIDKILHAARAAYDNGALDAALRLCRDALALDPRHQPAKLLASEISAAVNQKSREKLRAAEGAKVGRLASRRPTLKWVVPLALVGLVTGTVFINRHAIKLPGPTAIEGQPFPSPDDPVTASPAPIPVTSPVNTEPDSELQLYAVARHKLLSEAIGRNDLEAARQLAEETRQDARIHPVLAGDIQQLAVRARGSANEASGRVQSSSGAAARPALKLAQARRLQGNDFEKQGNVLAAIDAYMASVRLFNSARPADPEQPPGVSATTSEPPTVGSNAVGVSPREVEPRKPEPEIQSAPTSSVAASGDAANRPVPAAMTRDVSSTDDATAVRAVLAEFALGYRTLDPAAIRKVWPSAPSLSFDQVRSYDITLEDVQIAVEKDAARATAIRNVRVQNAAGRPQVARQRVVFIFRRSTNGWLIQSLE